MSAPPTIAPRGLPLDGETSSAASPADIEVAVRELASLMAESHGDELGALEELARVAVRLARRSPDVASIDDEGAFAMVGSWSLDHGMLPGPHSD